MSEMKLEPVDLTDEVQGANDRNDVDVKTIIQRKASTKRMRTELEGELSLEQFRISPTYCRIPASSVAALCGLNPFSNLPQLLFELVYQTYLGQLLLQTDATALGLSVVGADYERENMLHTASVASKETKDLVKYALEVGDGKRKIDSLEEVHSLQKKIEVQATKAQATGKLSKRQVANLVDQTRGHISTGFGTSHEDDALDIYEKRMGCKVRERNECFFEWRFRRRDAENPHGVTAEPIGKATRKACAHHLAPELNVLDAEQDRKPIGGADGEKEKPFFRIVGAIDGVRDELYLDSSEPKTSGDENKLSDNKQATSPPNPEKSAKDTASGQPDKLLAEGEMDCVKQSRLTAEQQARIEKNRSNALRIRKQKQAMARMAEEDDWALRPIIVECKHRMSSAKIPPPLYDQIQTCIYCNMYQVNDADLIQVIRGKTNETSSVRDKEIKIEITRISLSDPIHNHKFHWRETLLPRLASFVDAVYRIRADDSKRYRLIMALAQMEHEELCNKAEEESWSLLLKECPWLMDCDVACNRKRT
mmetsp:Transcript_20374/g.47854  ORF Transcript_20374/g.47854 Transcript_20374/m.47854 type:complete len:536 (-) Transcript_20374:35-1642(-)